MEYTILNNKLECPVIGIGTFMLSPADAENSVREKFTSGVKFPRLRRLAGGGP